MPSKGASRATHQAGTATIAPVAGPAVVVRPATREAIVNVAEPIQAVVGAPIAAGGATALAQAEAVPVVPFVPELEDPSVDTPEWADIYACLLYTSPSPRD